MELELQQQRRYAEADEQETARHSAPPARRGKPSVQLRALHRLLDALPQILDLLMRGLGPVLVLAAWCIFAFVSVVYFYSIVPCRGWSATSGVGLPVSVLGLSLLFQVYYNHIMATFTPPGGVPKEWVRPRTRESRR